MSQLLPEWVQDVRDTPRGLFNAIRMALAFLSFEELPKDEKPPRKIWLDGDALNAHFEKVERDRDQRYGKDGRAGPGPIEDPVQNAVKLVVD